MSELSFVESLSFVTATQSSRQQRMTRLRRQGSRLIVEDPELDRRFRLMLTATGIGEISALQILGELAVLPDTLDARQWVAFSGLDPRLFKSGKSVEKRPRISRGGSRHLCRALYMPALVALRRSLSAALLSKLAASWQSSSASHHRSYAKTAARAVRHVPH